MRFAPIAALIVLIAGPALAQPPRVVADTPITASLVAQVMGDLGAPGLLLPPGSSPHHHQMRPSEAAALQSADLLVWMGPALTPWLERAAAPRGAGRDLQLLDVPDTALRAFGEAEHDAGQDDGDGPEATGDHGHDGIDPHAWLDPANAAIWLRAIAGDLSRRDPGNAATYADNAAAAQARLSALDHEITGRLAPLADRRFVVFHDAYGYFTDHFGLQPAIAVALGDATSPSAARIADVQAQIGASGARCAFPEFGHDKKLIEAAIGGSDVVMGAALDPAGAAIEGGAGLYEATLRGLAETVEACLSGG
ncbi:zinc ABC transporter substrate-binding protein [Paracoccus spongiarum]|uniref:High-affinity zinc uptake system protein ZnuA n=1 Tax=Paracoccus spongiarum TaxID=3064387 RepID=A0ABT9JDR3_9RHOB|nr:zinc ABC transporter substrate-binding protein [Paracoccus sp. 2205BS29-5]MDP5307960.1 zinc ABC transporter substrate-binding protein [Paracoccus sp. 2205BS29-5]